MAGKTWRRTGTDPRIRGRLWYFGEVYVDPKNPDTVYLPMSHLSLHGRRENFRRYQRRSRGDDYHALWIDPTNPQRMIFGSDQGAGVSVDEGHTWSSWYNQPTAQFYHVAVDNDFPYHVYGAQQDSGSVFILSRSNDGAITSATGIPLAPVRAVTLRLTHLIPTSSMAEEPMASFSVTIGAPPGPGDCARCYSQLR